ncbi:MAG: secondary thiamine-phosphate synthase enzyme YjbQ, partial [bacterium]|nr:secondary thiamine-phosphate synthase enzyme YjbQ [bacterium]
HTTAGITINEDADPDVIGDIEKHLDKLIPDTGVYRHIEGNSPAHIKSSLIGHSLTIPVENGKLLLGRWQGVFFCEFDGPRTRQVIVKLIKEV